MSIRKLLTRLFALAGRLDNRGNALVELGVTMPVLAVTLMGVVSGSLVLDRYLTVLELGRAGGVMFARGTDFLEPGNRNALLLAAKGLDIEAAGGRGVIYLTRLVKAPTGSTNAGQAVVAEHYVIGNPSVRATQVGTSLPACGPSQDCAGQIWPDDDRPLPNGHVFDPYGEAQAIASARAQTALASLPEGESMYVAEVYHQASDIIFGQYWPEVSQLASVTFF